MKYPVDSPYVVMFNEVTDLNVPPGHTLKNGEVVPVFRGNGPKEGELMGTARVELDEDGDHSPALHVTIG